VQFLSVTWVAWLLGTVAVYWLLPMGARRWFLVAITGAFLAIHSPASLALLTLFVALLALATRAEKPGAAASLVTAVVMLGILVFFKLRVVAGAEGLVGDTLIPLGLSYYTFRCLHFLFDRYRGTVARTPLPDLLAYLFFLPTIVVGPIHRAPAFLNDRRDLRWSADLLSEGIERIVGGYFKIAVLGNFLVTAKLGEVLQSIDPAHTFVLQYARMVRTGLNLYLQFSGFSDVAIGFALLLGYRVIENFRWPYLSVNIAEFWRRWHISLTSWSRDYVYMPLLGVTRNPYAATVASFLMIGLWHELSLRYVFWALYHAGGVLAWQSWQRIKRRRKWIARTRVTKALARGLAVLATVHFVWLGFALVRESDVGSALAVLENLLLPWR
jgi:alginate O-acetyltransferase complex protein AlgI